MFSSIIIFCDPNDPPSQNLGDCDPHPRIDVYDGDNNGDDIVDVDDDDNDGDDDDDDDCSGKDG